MQTISFYLWLITLLLGPLLLAGILSRLLNIRTYLIKLAIVFYALAFLVVGPLLVEQRTPRFGIDLKGGTILVYEMDQDKIPADMSGRELMEKMTARSFDASILQAPMMLSFVQQALTLLR